MIENFAYTPVPTRAVFGQGSVRTLPDEAARLGCHRLLLLSTAAQADQARSIASLLADAIVGHFSNATMHTPTDVTRQAMTMLAPLQVDGILAIGGGSTVGLGKAIAYRTDLPQITVPTTYAGSEMTPILGETEAGIKTTRSDRRIQPEVAIYDVDLTLDLPVPLSVASGINAIAHAIEAIYAVNGNPVVSMMAVEGAKAIARGLPRIVRDPHDAEGRAAAFYGAWLCGICLGSAGMALHHKLCHTLGGTFDLPHAETHAVVLPHAVAYNQSRLGTSLDGLKGVFGDDVAAGLFRFARSVGAPASLRSLGMPQGGIDDATRLALASPYPNPRPLEEAAIRALIARAWAGDPPISEGR